VVRNTNPFQAIGDAVTSSSSSSRIRLTNFRPSFVGSSTCQPLVEHTYSLPSATSGLPRTIVPRSLIGLPAGSPLAVSKAKTLAPSSTQ